MTRPPWYFVLPEAKQRDLPSGGNIYNERIIQSLKKVGQPVRIISDSDYVSAIKKDQAGIYWVDTLLLDQLPDLLPQQPAEVRSLLIVHHLPSLAPASGQSVRVLQDQEKPLLNWFQGFLATSTFTKNYLRQQGCTQPVLVVEPGVRPATNAPDRTTQNLRALMVANIVERKGILPWLHWLADHIKEKDLFSMTIVGRTDIEPYYAQQCTDLLEKNPILNRCITLARSQSPDRMPHYYQQANLFISTAQMETFGMALQEAVSYKLPVLALEGGYSAHLISPGKNGVAFAELSSLGDFFLSLVREPAKFATLYQQAQHYSLDYLDWRETAQLLLRQFDQFFDYAP